MSDIDSKLVEKLAQQLLISKYSLSTAESCTGGGIGYWLTSIPGSSNWYFGGHITYSNTAKIRDIGVSPKTLAAFGAVSEQVAGEMALGCAKACKTSLAISVTGIAGPDGYSPEKPVGMVCFGWALSGKAQTQTVLFSGGRSEIRAQAIRHALLELTNLLEKKPNQG